MKRSFIILFLLLGFGHSYAQEYEPEVLDPVEDEDLGYDSNKVFEIYAVSIKAKFPGGEDSLLSFIEKNLVISDSAKKEALSGIIVVAFTIEKDGSLSNITIDSKRKLGFGLEEAALDVVRKMPKWEPATHRDVAVRMRFRLPIRIKM